MKDAEWQKRPFLSRSGESGTAVRLHARGRHLEVSFDPGFSADDLDRVRAIPGRRWAPDRRVWTLPNTPESKNLLRTAFGQRLVVQPAAVHTDPRRSSRDRPEPGQPQPVRPGTLPHDVDALLEAVRRAVRVREYSRKTEAAYVGWVRRFLRFSAHVGGVGRLQDLDAAHALAFLEHLAQEERLAAASRNQAASAVAFMFRELLGRDELAALPRAKGPRRVPMVLTHREVLRVLRELTGKYYLIGVLLYSAGLRLEECLRLRVKEVDFELRQILVRDGKGKKDRYVPLARRATDLVRARIRRVAELHARDRAKGHGWAPLPGALHRKDPGAGYELGWQFIFPGTTLHDDPATGRTGRWPLHATAVQREMKAAVRRSGISKRATCHTLRHSFATETLRGGCDVRTLQQVMGHKDLRTTSIYLHVVEQTGLHIRSPLDRPDDPDDLEPYATDPVDRAWSGARSRGKHAARQGTNDGVEPKPPATDSPPAGDG